MMRINNGYLPKLDYCCSQVKYVQETFGSGWLSWDFSLVTGLETICLFVDYHLDDVSR